MDLQLVHGRIIDAASDGEWIFVGSVGVVFGVGAVLGLISWLKGRQIVAIEVWLLLTLSGAAMLLPRTALEPRVDLDQATLSRIVVGMVAISLAAGFVSSARMARPPSWWAQRRYDNDRYAESIARHQWTRPQAK